MPNRSPISKILHFDKQDLSWGYALGVLGALGTAQCPFSRDSNTFQVPYLKWYSKCLT
jgi:hypothetical protein